MTFRRLRPGVFAYAQAEGVELQGARPAPVNGTSSGLGAPCKARAWESSTAAREKSRAFALRSVSRRTSCSRNHTPASVHSAGRRRQVVPEPEPPRARRARTSSAARATKATCHCCLACRESVYQADGPLFERAQKAGGARTDIGFDDLLRMAAGITATNFPDDAQRDRVPTVTLEGTRVSAG